MPLARCLLLGSIALSVGCGGSSSETPFPVEPDFAREKAGAQPNRQVVFSGREEPRDGDEEELEGDEQPAAPTWGGGRKRSKRSTAPAPDPEPEPEIEIEPE